MLLKVVKRALCLFLVLLGISAATIGAVVWHHIGVANPCPADGLPNGQPVTCYYRLQPTGDWLSAICLLAAGFAICLLASWLSFKFGRRAGEV